MHVFTKIRYLLTYVLFQLSTTYSYAQVAPPFSYTSEPRDTLGRLHEDEERRTIDPSLNRVPYERLAQEREKLMQSKGIGASTNQAIQGITWQERGPSNAGGQTRALLFDPNDPAKKKVWAASPAGGLWYTNDITDANASWTVVSDGWENLVVTAIAADPSNPQIMYAGTGDGYGSAGNGGGIWKTTNGGATWSRLNSTIPANTASGSLSASFNTIQRLVVNSSGYVFAATRYGVVRSTDGGASWQFALAPNQGVGAGSATGNAYNDFVSDLEMGANGTLYVAFWPSRIFKSTNATGTSWTEITPATGGERTELALAPSTNGTSQVIYAVSRAYNSASYSNDIKWFKKSADAGATWTDVAIPMHSWGAHFTAGYGSSYLTISVLPTDPNTVWAGGYGLFRSTDGGASWSGQLDSNYAFQQGIWSQPGTASAGLATESGVCWSANWGDNTAPQPTIAIRRTGHQIGSVSSASMKPAPGSPYLLASVSGLGIATLTNAGLSAGTSVLSASPYGSDRTFIDTDNPAVQVVGSYSSWWLYNGTSVDYLFGPSGGWYSSNPAAYDSQRNTLYTAEILSGNNVVRRTTGIGSSIASTTFVIASPYPTVMELGNAGTNLFVGFSNSLLVRYSNLDQTVPTATTIATDKALPTYSSISNINVGSTDDDILITLSNYGVPSVWFTNNGGVSWTSKDPANSGLPDVPVRTALFNPQNRQQVLLGTDLGVWTTNSFFDPNPGWSISNTGIPLLRINQLRYRASDGRLIAATAGRGIFQSDALAVPYTPSSVSITAVSSKTLCAGNTFTVSFATSGPLSTMTTTYEVWLSDATGNFAAQRLIGKSTTSPVSVTLPSAGALSYGTGYLVRVTAVNADLTSPPSTPLTIGTLTGITINDSRTPSWQSNSSASICPGDRVRLNVSAGGLDSYQWLLNDITITGATSQTYLTSQPGAYRARVQQGGCEALSLVYQVYESNYVSTGIASRFGERPQCNDEPVTLYGSYKGELATLQWKLNGNDLPGATSTSLVTAQSGTYSLSVNSNGCYIQASLFALTLGRTLYANLQNSNPADSVLCAGSSAGTVRLWVGDINNFPIGANGYSIDWYRDNQPLNKNQNQWSYTADQPGVYTYELRQGTCVTRSNPVIIRTGTIVPPVIDIYQPKTACPGDSRTMNLYSLYSAFQSCQWQKDGVDIAGATGSSFTAQSSGAYTVRATKGSCSATSQPVSLTFANAMTPIINVQDGGAGCVNIWLDVRYYAQQSGAQFQWYKDGTVLSGATDNSSNAQQPGLYAVRVTNGNCTGLSKGVYARPYTNAKPIISAVPSSVCGNNTVRLTAPNLYSGIQWKRNGVAVTGGNSWSYFPTQSGLYSVYAGGCGGAESDPVEIKIGEPTTASLTTGALIAAGKTAQVPITFTGAAPWSFTLSNGQSVTGVYQNPYLLSLSPTTTTSYSITRVENACGTGTSAGSVMITVGSGNADLSLSSIVSSRTPGVGDIISYSLVLTNDGPMDAYSIQLTNRLPAGVEFVDAQSSGISADNGVVTVNIGSLFLNSSVTISYRLRIARTGTFFNAVQVAASNMPDPDSQPNSGTGDGEDDQSTVDLRTADGDGTVIVSANPNQIPLLPVVSNQPPTQLGTVELSLAIQSSLLTPKVGEVVSLSLIVSNRGRATATNLVVQTQLPTGWLVSNSNGFVVNGQTVLGFINQLPAGTSQVLVLPVVINSNGLVQAQVQEVAEPVSNATPGNGYTNGERDEANLSLRVR